MRDHLATLLYDFRRYDREIAVVRHQGNRRTRHHLWRNRALSRPLRRPAHAAKDRPRRPRPPLGRKQRRVDRRLLRLHDARRPRRPPRRLRLPRIRRPHLPPTCNPNSPSATPSCSIQLPAPDGRASSSKTGPAALPDEEAGLIPGLSHDTPLQILFTSGTTGDPKGIVITHGNVLASIGPIEAGAQPYMRYERLVHPLRFLHTLPLSHVFGQTMGLWIPPIFKRPGPLRIPPRRPAPHRNHPSRAHLRPRRRAARLRPPQNPPRNHPTPALADQHRRFRQASAPGSAGGVSAPSIAPSASSSGPSSPAAAPSRPRSSTSGTRSASSSCRATA